MPGCLWLSWNVDSLGDFFFKLSKNKEIYLFLLNLRDFYFIFSSYCIGWDSSTVLVGVIRSNIFTQS